MRISLATLRYCAFFAALFLALKAIGVTGDYIAGITTAAVGYVAFYVYLRGIQNATEDAAKILILDIRKAEEAADAVRAHNSNAAWLKVIWQENTWNKNKHMFVGRLNADEYQMIDQFFHNWEGLTRAKVDATNYSTSAVTAKSAAVSVKLLDLDRTAPDFAQKHAEIVARANLDTWLFEPDIIQNRATHFLTALQPVSGSVAFSKLRQLAQLSD
jgi:hypothetical protein